MKTTKLLAAILHQPQSLERSLNYQKGEGQDAFMAAVTAIANARTVFLSGMGSSYFAAVPLAYHLGVHGIHATSIEASELLHYRYPSCRESTVVLVSRSGDTVEIVRLLPILKQLGATVVGVTNEPGSGLARHADVAVLVNSLPDEAVSIQSYSASLACLIAAGVRATAGEPFEAPAAVLAAALEACVEASTTWQEFLCSARTMYLLARGPAIGSALEGALLFHEVAKQPAAALSAGFFRHGPVEVVSEAFRCIVFAADPRTRNLNLALAADLAAYGGQVAVIGPEGAPGCMHWHVPECDPRLCPLFEILPVQFAALRLAEWRGIVPGRLGIASPVTLTEVGFAGLTR